MGPRIVPLFRSAIFSREAFVLIGIASWLQDDCFTSCITSDSLGQRKWEGHAEGDGTCIRRAKACSEAPSRIPLRFPWPPLSAKGTREAGVLAGYLATLNRIGMSENEEGGQDEY